MTRIAFDCFPGGRRKALTLSYDDGTAHDRRLVAILNRSGIRATFNLNSGRLDQEGFLASAEVAALFAGHAVAAHTVNHPCLSHLSREGVLTEVVEDRRALERLVGYPVRGLAYPGGDYDEAVVAMLPSLGVEYSRTAQQAASFGVSHDFLRWPFSCHHNDCLERGQKFLAVSPLWGLQLLHVMGHSFEFERADNWEIIEEFCSIVGGNADIWYATNIEIVDYLRAARAVRSSVDGTMLYNSSGLEVWFCIGSLDQGTFGSIGPGATLRL
ncbi:MAG TPA: polysaccharide deacetylase family protein [Abditibacteriaceae bacterium]|nr:polysaccharide deacetylase family protein [Abditibacteriaceae bacterium]